MIIIVSVAFLCSLTFFLVSPYKITIINYKEFLRKWHECLKKP